MSRTAQITISFDDCRKSGFVLGSSILEKYGFLGTFYPVTQWVGQPDQYPFADWDDLKRIADHGHEIGNHTDIHSETFATDWTRPVLEWELSNATERLKDHGIVPKTVAYPYGRYSYDFIKAVENSGFIAARTIDDGFNLGPIEPFKLQSWMVEDKHTFEDMKRKVDEVIGNNGWLIFCFHHLDGDTFISTPADVFEQLVQYIHSKSVPVVTLAEGIKRV